MKFILHTDRPENLGVMARAAATCAAKDLAEGEWGVLSYIMDDREVAAVAYVKRKSCLSLFDQSTTHSRSPTDEQ